jgi:hypothetical protein
MALLPEDTGREGVGEAEGVSRGAVIRCFCGVVVVVVVVVEVALGALLVGSALFVGCWIAIEGEGVCRRRTDPIMERGIWTRKEPLLVGEDGGCGGEYSWPCLRAVSAVKSMSSIVLAMASGST